MWKKNHLKTTGFRDWNDVKLFLKGCLLQLQLDQTEKSLPSSQVPPAQRRSLCPSLHHHPPLPLPHRNYCVQMASMHADVLQPFFRCAIPRMI